MEPDESCGSIRWQMLGSRSDAEAGGQCPLPAAPGALYDGAALPDGTPGALCAGAEPSGGAAGAPGAGGELPGGDDGAP